MRKACKMREGLPGANCRSHVRKKLMISLMLLDRRLARGEMRVAWWSIMIQSPHSSSSVPSATCGAQAKPQPT